ncbi:MAG: hypothetical protein WC712_00625 [Candidatus Brocadiia bacterium]
MTPQTTRRILSAAWLLVIGLLLVALLSAEDVPQRSPVGFPNAFCQTVDEVFAANFAVNKPPGLNAGSWRVWALANLLMKRCGDLICGGTRDIYPLLEEFQSLIFPELDSIREHYGAESAEYRVALTVYIAVAATHYVAVAHPDDALPEAAIGVAALKQLEEQFAPVMAYSSTRDSLVELRIAASLCLRGGALSRFGGASQEPGPPAAFVINRYDNLPRLVRQMNGASLSAFMEVNFCPLDPVVRSPGTPREPVNLKGLYHPFVLAAGNFPPQLVILGAGEKGGPQISEAFGALLGTFFKSPAFLGVAYGYEVFAARSTKEKQKLLVGTLSQQGRSTLDLRALELEATLYPSFDIRALTDPKNPAYSRIMTMACRNDHPECWGSDVLGKPGSAGYEARVAKYNSYLAKCEAVVVAMYKKTTMTSVWSLTGDGQKSRTAKFLSPDYSEKPELCLAYVPPEWRRVNCYLGPGWTLFENNALGLTDHKLKIPEHVGY